MILKFETIQTEPYNKVSFIIDGKRFGNELDDNANNEDGFRFHDLYHFGLYYFFNYKEGVTATLLDEVKPSKTKNSVEESVVMFMFQLPKYKHSAMMHSIMFDTLCDLLTLELKITFDPDVLLDFIYKVSDFILYLEQNNNTEFTVCEKNFYKNLLF